MLLTNWQSFCSSFNGPMLFVLQASPKPIHIISNCEQVSSLLDGEYDEDAEAAAFQLALQEWRKGKTGASQNTYNVMDASDNIESGKCMYMY